MTVAGILVTDPDSLDAAADALDAYAAALARHGITESYDAYCERMADMQAAWAESEDDPEPEPPTASRPRTVVPLFVSMLAASDGRRGIDSRESKRQRRQAAFARCA